MPEFLRVDLGAIEGNLNPYRIQQAYNISVVEIREKWSMLEVYKTNVYLNILDEVEKTIRKNQ